MPEDDAKEGCGGAVAASKWRSRLIQLEVISHVPAAPVTPTPILFVHGMFHGAWCWEANFLPYFAQRGYAAYAVSLRGHAGSEGADRLRWSALHEYVSDVAQVVAQLSAPPVLVGHSMGGLIVQQYLQTHHVAGGVLLASVPPAGMLPASLRALRRHPAAFLKACLTLSPYQLVATAPRYRDLFFASDVDAALLAGYFSRLGDESFRAYLEMMFAAVLPLRAITATPLLVLGMERDRVITHAEVATTARRHHTQATMLAGVGHAAMLESGWQGVADSILGWLRQQGM